MISYFPHPYKNEALYSIIARYGIHIGISSKAIISQELFDYSSSGIFPEFTCNIENLSSKLGHFSKEYSQLYFLMHHTTAPIYEPFIKKTKNIPSF